MSDNQFYSHGEIESLLTSFSPLVKATAIRYSGRGAEYEDLFQEGHLALLQLIPKCKDRKWLPAFLKSRLPGYVRTAAARLRGGRTMPFEEDWGNLLHDGRSREERREVELMELLTRTLTEDELDLTQALLEGFTQRELAELSGVSQQAVSARVRRIRDKLSPVLCMVKIAC